MLKNRHTKEQYIKIKLNVFIVCLNFFDRNVWSKCKRPRSVRWYFWFRPGRIQIVLLNLSAHDIYQKLLYKFHQNHLIFANIAILMLKHVHLYADQIIVYQI